MRLLLLSAIWGGSFLFIRIAAPYLSPPVLACSRFLCATAFLAVVVVLWKRPVMFRKNWRMYAIQGALGATIPFLLIGYAAQTLPASIMAVLNATAPIWAAVMGVVLGQHRLTFTNTLGLLFGTGGVAILVGYDPSMLAPGAAMAVLAAGLAPLCYSLNAIYMSRVQMLDPITASFGYMLMSSLYTLPMTPFALPEALPPAGVIASVVVLGVVCSGISYLIYLKLMADAGTTSALTVTFLIPVFGILWGALFLGEHVGWNTLIGSVIVITGTALVTGFRPRLPWRRKAAPA